ncbi:hypothetical protein AVEN_185268-1, partial [Araneus ventricosus]
MTGTTEAQASVMRRRRFCNVGRGVAYTCPFMCPHKKKFNGVKSGSKGIPLRKPFKDELGIQTLLAGRTGLIIFFKSIFVAVLS